MDLVLQTCRGKGWFFTEEGYEYCTESLKDINADLLIKKALDIDLKDIGDSTLHDVNKGRLQSLSGCLVLQVQKIRNVSAPKANEKSQHAPQLLRVYLSDGHNSISAIQNGQWTSTNLTLDTPPGTKICLKAGSHSIVNSFLLLSSSQFTVLGGKVALLVEKWQVNRSVGSGSRVRHGKEGGPPPWVPFGQKILGTDQIGKSKFKALAQETGEGGKGNDVFDQQRQTNIAEISKVMDGKKKSFQGKGTQILVERQDHHKDRRPSFQDTNKMGQQDVNKRETFKRDTSDRQERGYNRRDRNRDIEESSVLPAKPTTLFDFLEQKLEINDDEKALNEAMQRSLNEAHDVKQSQNQSNYHSKFSNSKHESRGHYEDRSRNPRDSWNAPQERQHYNQNSESNYQDRNYSQKNSRTDAAKENSFDNKRSFNKGGKPGRSTARGGHSGNYNVNPYKEERATNKIPLQSFSSFPELGTPNIPSGLPIVKPMPVATIHTNPATKQRATREGVHPPLVVGDCVNAKYWEDQKFYPAVVHGLSSSGLTAVVQFTEYGNFEEVFLKDVQPKDQQPNLEDDRHSAIAAQESPSNQGPSLYHKPLPDHSMPPPNYHYAPSNHNKPSTQHYQSNKPFPQLAPPPVQSYYESDRTGRGDLSNVNGDLTGASNQGYRGPVEYRRRGNKPFAPSEDPHKQRSYHEGASQAPKNSSRFDHRRSKDGHQSQKPDMAFYQSPRSHRE